MTETKFLTTGEKNGSIYALCLETFVLDWGIELGLGRIFQIRFSCLVIWSNDFVDKIRVCNHRYRCFDLGFCLDFWRQTILRTLNIFQSDFYHTRMPVWAFFDFTNVFLYDKINIAKAEKRETQKQDGGFRANQFYFLGRPIILLIFYLDFSKKSCTINSKSSW